MELLTYFTNKLSFRDQSLDQSEKMWDERAEHFYHNQKHGSHYFAEEVPKLLQEKGIINKSSRIIDIGAGSGRYAIPLARASNHVYALDLSQKMLGFIEDEMAKNGLTNFTTLKSAWPLKNPPADIDLAFAAMCPATRSLEGIKAMIEVTNKFAVITQFTHSSDNIIDTLVAKGHLVIGKHDPHNNRGMLQAYFNILWELGYEPEVSYLHDIFPVEQQIDEALTNYQKRFPDTNSEQIRATLKQYENNNLVMIEKQTTLAVITWRVS